MAATTIDEVLARLTGIIDESLQTGSRAGFFAALYYKVTAKVKEGISKNEFEDGARIEKLDVVFANRYKRFSHSLLPTVHRRPIVHNPHC